MAIKKLGHVGIFVRNLPAMKSFYADVLGLQVSDETSEAVFMSSHPDQEHHEFALFEDAGRTSCVQQISFSCERLEDVVGYYERFRAKGVRLSRVVSHGNAIGLYFYDPEDNMCEVYWTTPWQAHQPFAVAVDLGLPIETILSGVERDARAYAATGHVDQESLRRQRAGWIEVGARV
jgi:catechol-2,3-dioxygenase